MEVPSVLEQELELWNPFTTKLHLLLQLLNTNVEGTFSEKTLLHIQLAVPEGQVESFPSNVLIMTLPQIELPTTDILRQTLSAQISKRNIIKLA